MTTCLDIADLVGLYVVEAYRLDRYDNLVSPHGRLCGRVVEAYRLDRYDNFLVRFSISKLCSCRSLSFG